ncbi:MAG: hypothetical protein ABIO70_13670 [Pseudomonadota bacterium]
MRGGLRYRRLRRGLREVCVGTAAAVLASGTSALVLVGLRAQPPTVGSSTGAWITGYVQGVLDLGSFPLVSALGRIPNTRSNLLFPLLTAELGRATGAAPVLVGHLLAAGSLGLAALLFGRLWARGRDPVAGLLAAVAFLWPPAVATGFMIRPDTLAFSLVLACALLAVRLARGGPWQAWLLAGLALGLTYHAREYMLAPAAGALLVGWGLDLHRRAPGSRGRSALGRLLALLAGALSTAALPLAMGFLPWNGLTTLLDYARQSQTPTYRLRDLFYLPALLPVWLLGAGGLALAIWRGPGPRRDAALVQAGLLLPFAAFLLSRQQSPQYYVFPEVVLLGGCVGWLDLLRGRWPRWGAAAAVMALGVAWSGPRAWALLDGTPERYHPRMHQEAWPARGSEVAAVVDWAMARTTARPLVVVSRYIENLGEIFIVRFRRPVISERGEGWGDELGGLRRLHRGQELCVLTVGGSQHPAGPAPGCAVEDTLETPSLLATLYRCDPGGLADGGQREGLSCVDWNGACQQRDWLEGGLEQLTRRARDLGPAFTAGAGPGLLPWGPEKNGGRASPPDEPRRAGAADPESQE